MPEQTSPILSLPYLMPSQAQKHVTHNEALQMLDALVQLRVAAFDTETPPADPAPGDTWALGATPTGAWAGQAGRLAIWQGEGWLFLAPQPGWRAWGLAEEELRHWDGSAWRQPPHLGLNTSADASNRLAVAAPATLLTHDGAGHQLKINKAAASDTGALLFQSGWSGRAEMGLLGDDDFSIKVSSDGSSWTEALRITGDGDVLVDGALIGGGADYAEYFEWADGNPSGADRRGIAVALDGGKIRPAEAGETPIGVVSVTPSVLGGGDTGGWRGKYLRDDLGSPLWEEDADGQQSRRLNPAYDPTRPYVPRAERAEWAMVGLIGKLRLRRGQPTDARWIRLRQVSDSIEEWLLR
ncbi:peptidase G2 autoproteolytic cleavage domain-containing protein [Pseudophaeobacter sp. 1A09344]|uniref:peptidase G2 autoproteolytic cleavage domain-containing protein n=1 Tax=Pseudophaeobacter sp. 1A09344 TaxID=3098144 RepID=UPI0034D3CB5E